MTALTRDRATAYREGIEVEFKAAKGAKIYAGSMVCTNAEGFAVPAAAISGYRFVGVALEQVDMEDSFHRGLSEMVRVRRHGVFEFEAIGISQSNVGDFMYVKDDQTFVPGLGIKVGVLIKCVSATKGWIDIAR